MALRPEAIMNMENSIQNAATKKMMNNSNGEAGPEPENPLDKVAFLSPQKMQEWNSYIDYTEKKGYRGKPELDKDNLGNKLFDEWKKANPKASISKEDMPSVRKSLLKLREETISDMKANKGKWKVFSGTPQEKELSGPDVDYTEFMGFLPRNEKSQDPNYIGQYMTRTKFPPISARIKETETKKIIGESGKTLRMPGMEEKQMAEAYKAAESSKKVPNRPL
jgi:hypothetical protein